MVIKITKLDRRHSGYGVWLAFVGRPPGLAGMHAFLEWREWCWAIWGSSKEINEFTRHDLFDGKHSSNPHWCWQNDQHNTRIYLKSDLEAAAFALRWA
jgi:hypothetical protein